MSFITRDCVAPLLSNLGRAIVFLEPEGNLVINLFSGGGPSIAFG
jgi:hypothetical protein